MILAVISLFSFSFYQGVTAFAQMKSTQGVVKGSNIEDELNLDNLFSSKGDVYETLAYSPLLSEVSDCRTQYQKRFQRADRAFEAVMYSYPVHYYESGEWKNIDNTLVADKDEMGNLFYRNTANEFSAQFAAEYKEDGNLVSITRDKYSLSFSFIDTGAKTLAVVENKKHLEAKTDEERDTQLRFPAELSSKISYNNIKDGTSLAYEVTPTGFTEFIEVKSFDSISEAYTTILRVTNGLIAKLNEDGSVDFFAGDKKVFTLDAPFMFDAKGEETYNIKVIFEVDKEKSNEKETVYMYKLIPDMEWLSAKERVYPVVIDPSVTTPFESSEVFDSFVSEGFPTTNYKGSGTLKIGYGEDSKNNWTYIKFPSLPSLSSGDVVIGSSINILRKNSSGLGEVMNLYNVTSNWSSTSITWNNKPTHSTDVIACGVGVAANARSNFDITNTMKKWYSGELINYGVMIRASAQDSTAPYYEYASSDLTHYPIAAPYASVIFINSTGVESTWSYHTQSVQRAGVGYVNDYNGHLSFSHHDLSTTSAIMPVSISHVYNTNNKDDDTFYGRGWNINYAQTLELIEIGGLNYYKHIDGDGTAHYYRFESANKYVNELNKDLVLTVSGSTKTITDKKDNRLEFNANNRLQYIYDSNGNYIYISYKTSAPIGAIYRIYDGSNKYATFYYDTNNKLSRITGPDGTSVLVEYEMSGSYYNLRAFKYPDAGEITALPTTPQSTFYYSSGRLTDAIDQSGYKIEYSYTSVEPFRVTKALSKIGSTSGQYIDFTYGWNKTLITDNNNRTMMYQFNNLGQAVSVRDVDGSAMYASFKGGDREQTLLAATSKLQKTNINLLVNHSMEDSRAWYNSSTGTSTFTFDTAESYIGSKSLKYTKTSGTGYIFQSVPISTNKTYTLSGYIKGSSGAQLIAGYYDASNNWNTITTGETVGENTNWTRYSITFKTPSSTKDGTIKVGVFVPSNVPISGLFLDCFMLEKTGAMNRYNLLENSDFSTPSQANEEVPEGWTVNATGAELIITTTGTQYVHPSDLSLEVMKIPGSTTAGRSIEQTVNASGSIGDCFTFGGWMRSETIPEFTYNSIKYGERKLVVQFYCGTTWKNGGSVSFNADTNEWQYACGAAVAPAAYTKVRIRAEYNRNCNNAYFDGLMLYFDEFAQSFDYDDNGNIQSVEALANQDSSFEYGTGPQENDLIGYTDPKGNEFNYTYDSKHNMLTATTAADTLYAFVYAANGQATRSVTSKKPTSGSTVTSDYITSKATYGGNTTGNQISTLTDARGKVTQYSYDSVSNLLTGVTDPRGYETTYTYDEMYRLATIANGTSNVSYDYTHNRLSKISRNGFDVLFAYDGFGNPTTTTIGGMNVVTNAYNNSRGTLTSTTYGNGTVYYYTYDELDRVTQIKRGSTVLYTYSYDGEGNLASATNNITGITTQYYYDTIGRLARSYSSDGSKAEYSFDKNNNLTRRGYTFNGTTWGTVYAYDKDNRPTRTTLNNSYYIDVAYNPTSTLQSRSLYNTSDTLIYGESFSYLNGVSLGSETINGVSYTGNAKTALLSSMITLCGGVSTTYSYSYDDNGNIVSISSGGSTITYTYDSLNQLTRENNPITNRTTTYTYDTVGNITLKKIYKYTISPLLTNPLSMIPYQYSTTGNKDQLVSYNGNTISYDSYGNPTTYGNYGFTWTGKELTGIMNLSPSTFVSSYTYDDNGLRTTKTLTGGTVTSYTWDGRLLIGQSNGTTTLTFSYDANGNVVSMFNGISRYYYQRNGQNDIVGILNSSGTQVVAYTYDTWGKLLSVTGSLATTIGAQNPFRYRGYYYDNETGFYYLQSRYYDPTTGRFISPDVLVSTGQGIIGHNMYAYCGNNPVNRADDEGQFWHIVVGAVIGGGFELAGQLLSGKSISEVNWTKVGVATVAGGVTAAIGPIAGAAVSGTTNVIMDAIDGKRGNELIGSFVIGAGASLIGSGVGKIVEKAGGKIAIRQLSKLSKSQIKAKVLNLYPAIRGSERNAIKSITYLTKEYADVGSRLLGKVIPIAFGQIAEGLSGIAGNHIKARGLAW